MAVSRAVFYQINDTRRGLHTGNEMSGKSVSLPKTLENLRIVRDGVFTNARNVFTPINSWIWTKKSVFPVNRFAASAFSRLLPNMKTLALALLHISISSRFRTDNERASLNKISQRLDLR